jgi:hypothetical protein
MRINGTLFVTFLMLFTALALSGVAAWFSVVGLIAIFAASPFAVAVMAGTLEVAKLVCASWVYNNWHRLPGLIKGYLTVAVVILMFITSMGIFGYLSKAHLDQGVPTGEVSAKVALYDEKIATERANIDTARTALKQMDAQVDQLLNRTDDDKGANRAVAVRKQQAAERKSLQKDIEVAQTAIAKLNEERAPVAAELRKVEAEVGPIKYIAALIYGDNPDVNTLERAVRWVTILLVSVFDPLAVIMLIAANFGMRNFRDEEKDPVEQLEEKLEEVKAEQATIKEELATEETEIDQWNKMLEAAEAEALKEREEERKNKEEMEIRPQPYPSTEEDVEELINARANKPVDEIPPVIAEKQTTYQELGDDYVQVNGKTFSKPVYNSLKAQGLLEQELAESILSVAPIEGISLERVKELINKIEKDEVIVDDLTLAEREAIKKYLESNA